jgi:hypothetical protein
MDEIKEPDEVVEEKDAEPEVQPDSTDIDKMAGVDLDVDLHFAEEEKNKEDEKEPEKKEVKPSEPTQKEKEYEERLSRLERDKSDLKKALHESRQEKKKAKESEPQAVLTDAELMKIVEEHKDDPKVMFNAVAYKMQQAMKTGKAEAVNEVEIKGKQGQLNAILKERIKEFDDESSEPRNLISRAKTDFNLDEHPFGDFLAASAAVYMDLPNIAKGWIEEGKKQALNGKADESRKEGIKKGQLSGGGPKIPAGKSKDELTPSELETARRMNLTTPEKLRIYKSQILKGRATNA